VSNKPEDLKRQKEEHKRLKRLRAEFEGTLAGRDRSVSPGYQFKPEQEDFNRWDNHISRLK